MELWTDYEGRTVAGEYKLVKLRRSEGRNGFFSTADASGHAAVIRLTEAHYDEEDQLARWRKAAAARQDHEAHLIGIERVGRTELEGVALTYALMEADDAVLAEVLAERPLTVPETLQVALSVSSALAALHARNLVHEHVNADNVLAVGEDVKLRSDCVRECLEDGEFVSAGQVAATRQKDLHDFGTLLLRCLTLESEIKPGNRLPEPFPRIIPAALEGSTSFAKIAAMLTPAPPPPAAVPPAPGAVAAAVNAAAAAEHAPIASSTSRAAHDVPAPIQQSLPLSPDVPRHREDEMDELDPEESTAFPLPKNWAIYTAAALVLLFVVWHFAGGKKAPKPASGIVPESSSSSSSSSASSPAQPVQLEVHHINQPALAATPQPTSASVAAANVAAASAPGWHVIAYTFHRQDQAQSRANAIAAKHPNLHPQVYSPTGGSPWLVSLGGVMNEREAQQLLHAARRDGLPRDTFIRNYRH
ncbi:Sporulation related domain-containing protein [Bryocella elongata]|uniref:Sporulation related domain-containing protein n=1 Tax=Bryocella elongata TaxID=863522 RepID=A0A1H6CAB9_9BACT|nr:SPOR domain-containing protein [Bryocella elongata]SEG69707.1 Sporulation related domain-containing protein [Bryocella elongata]